ncbi:MAG: hypothetical protein PHQ12_02005, partial [Chthoniobacteraceae bacterium]|nr:hypothetical protein [Chthoniobacteraceae bacterium]
MTLRHLLALFCVVAISFAGIAQAEPAEAGQCYALLVGGLGGNGPYSRWYADWIGRFKTYLTQSANVPEA